MAGHGIRAADQRGNTRLDRVSFIVLDEADRMLDMGFEPQIKEATPGWTACPSSSWMRLTECWTWDSSRRSKRLDRVSFIVLDEADRMLDMGFEPQIQEATPGWTACPSSSWMRPDRMLDMGFEPQIKEATPGWTACPSSSWMRLTECWTWDSSRRSKRLDRVSFIVLDEADRMLDMGFEPQIKEVMSRLPARHQTLLFSATMPKEIEDLAGGYLTNPVTVKVGAVSTPTANVSQSLEHSNPENKMELLCALLGEEAASSETGGPPMPLTVVFVERKLKCDEVAECLRLDGIGAVALHGGLGQNERDAALRDFSKGVVRVLVATDVASRGLDIKGIGHVVNMDLPKTFEDYVHRIGRTGRAGTKGRATSFWSDRDSFLVSQIKTALAEMEKGNTFAFATGKSARQEERQLAAAFKSNMKLGAAETSNDWGVKVDDKYAFMAKAPTPSGGAVGDADAAWDD
eukprot:gene28742-31920_t